MANICTNSIVFRAPSEKELAGFFNDGLKADHPEYEPKESLEEIARWISDYTQANPPFKRPPMALPALRFSSWMPTPAEYAALDGGGGGAEARARMLEESGQSDLYHYNLWKYSVKWDCPITDDSELNFGADPSGAWRAGLEFDTPWSGPAEWVRRLHARYPGIRMELLYREDGMEIRGAAIAAGGNFAVLRGEALEPAFPGEFLPGGFFEDWEGEDQDGE